jgi:2-C-methyl-D-erythritol 4-phosphate cytidylyltransferase
MSNHIGIIFAGGIGKRMGQNQIPKQFLLVEEKPIIIHTLEYFQRHKAIDDIYIACVADWREHLEELLEHYEMTKVRKVVDGGETAQHSIYQALTAARTERAGDAIVLVHDGVRPFITAPLITELIQSVESYGSGITCTPCSETIIESEDGVNVGHVPLRKNTWAAQAPQAFRLDELIAVHDEIRCNNPLYSDMVDACTMYRQLGRPVHMVHGNKGNVKITNPEDVYILEGLMQYRKTMDIMGVLPE